jgi:Phytanoyl-CoA dioxygenase (PhyH)
MVSDTTTQPETRFDLEEYVDRGVVVLPRFLDAPTVSALNDAWDTLKRDFLSASMERNARFLFGTLPGPIGQLYAHSSLVSLVRSVIGPDLALYMNRVLLKDEHWGGAVAIHQDMPYFTGGQDKVSIFVPLQPTQAEGGNGGLKFVVGSHKYGALSRGAIDRSCFETMPEVAPSLEVGDIVVMNFMTWHYSEDAVVPDDRPLMQIVYQPSSDGSFGGPKLGVAEPMLVSGSWKTRHFAEWNRGIIPDA